jgi:hypothetical protein
MAFSFLYLAVGAVLGAFVRSRRRLPARDIELLVLQHELAILRRQPPILPAPPSTAATPILAPFSVSLARQGGIWGQY